MFSQLSNVYKQYEEFMQHEEKSVALRYNIYTPISQGMLDIHSTGKEAT